MLSDKTTSHSIKHKPLLYLQNQENGNSTIRRHWWSLRIPQEKSLLFEDNIFSPFFERKRSFVSASQMTHEVWANHLWNTFLKKTLHSVARQKHTHPQRNFLEGGAGSNNKISRISLRPVWQRGFRAFPSVSEVLCRTICHSFVPLTGCYLCVISEVSIKQQKELNFRRKGLRKGGEWVCGNCCLNWFHHLNLLFSDEEQSSTPITAYLLQLRLWNFLTTLSFGVQFRWKVILRWFSGWSGFS